MIVYIDYKGAGTVADSDPYWDDVVLLAPMSDGATSIGFDKTSYAQAFVLDQDNYGYSPFLPKYPIVEQGTLFGEPTLYFNTDHPMGESTSGKFGSAFSVSGCPNQYRFVSHDWTLEFHYQLDSTDGANAGGWLLNNGGFGYAITNGTNSSEYARGAYSVWIASNGAITVYVGPSGSGGTHQVLTTAAQDLDEWHHVRLVCDGTDYTISVDGAPAVTAAITVDQSYPDFSYFVIGGLWSQSVPAPQYCYRGYMANVRITAAARETTFTPPSAPYPTN